MINNPQSACMSCFTQHAAPTNPCSVCGYNETGQEIAPHILRPRTILNGKYLLGKVLGQGGFGITYIGWDLNLDIKVAVKEYYPSGFVTRETASVGPATVQPFTGSQGDFFIRGREKFVSEAKTLARFFALPGIVSIKDYFQENGTAYISMEYIDGQTLKDYLEKTGGRLPVNQVFDLMKPVMYSLAEVHNSGLIHRDISPDNIMISKEGQMKLLDFGAARDFSDSGNKSMSIMLKPGFAPEEQYRSRGVQGPWTDVYALSASIYKCITGITPEESIERTRIDNVRPPSMLGIPVNPAQEAALMRGMAVLQEYRFQSVSEMYASLYGQQSGAPESHALQAQVAASVNTTNQISTPLYTQTPAPAAAKPKRMTKQKWIIAVACGVVVGFLSFALSMWGGSDNRTGGPEMPVVSPPSIELPAATDTPIISVSTGPKGTLTETGYSSEFLDLSFTAPEGYTMVSREGFEELTGVESTGLEMMVSSLDATHNIIVGVEKLASPDITERQFLDDAQLQYSSSDTEYEFNRHPDPVIIANREFAVLTAVAETYRQYQYVRRVDDYMLLILITSSNDMDSIIQAIFLLNEFHPYSGAEVSIAGTWVGTSDIDGEALNIELTFDNSGSFYLLEIYPDRDRINLFVFEGTYEVFDYRIQMSLKWPASIGDNWNTGYLILEIPETSMEALIFIGISVGAIDANALHIDNGVFGRVYAAALSPGAPSGLWSFEHREELINRDNTPAPASISIGGETIDVGVTNVVLGERRITDISELRWLTHVTELNLRVNSISDISALTNLTTLTWLNLFNNSITHINALSGLTNLHTLFISENAISDISALEGLTSLTFLAAYSCSISDISALGSLTRLETLLLNDNLISDITVLKGLTNLKTLWLDGNPLTQQQLDELREALPNCDIRF